MPPIPRQPWTRALVAAALVLGAPRAARAGEPTVDECLKASEAGQRLRDAGHFVRARKTWNTCTATACPAMVRQDCAAWIADLDRSMPSVIVAVRTQDNRDVQGTRISIDGAPEPLTGRPTALDPGEHTVVIDAPGFAATTEHVFVNATEKNRLVIVKLAPEASPPRAAAPAPPTTTEPSRPSSPHGGPPVASWVLGGVGVATLGASVFLGLSAQKQLSDAEHAPCAATKSCDESIRTSAKNKLVLADVTLGIGVAALAAGALWWALEPAGSTTTTTTAGARVRVGVRGTTLVAEGAF